MSDTSMEVLHGLKQTLKAAADSNATAHIGAKEARDAANAISDIQARAGADAEKRKRETSSLREAINTMLREGMAKRDA